jgi:hypothetical protein
VASSLHRIFGKAAREERAVLQGTSLHDLLTAGSGEHNRDVKALVGP